MNHLTYLETAVLDTPVFGFASTDVKHPYAMLFRRYVDARGAVRARCAVVNCSSPIEAEQAVLSHVFGASVH
ncbi:hypothetical protein VSR83_40985 [Paraburkholderia unamae]|uniref:Uncharacterized protein n=2 Tax=Paraburkholderia unamae TaxID=219649 RepID=A0ACC6RWZ4_9BURK